MQKILIIGGANVHNKLVNAAHEMGLYVIVVDYLKCEDSPAKQLADEHYELNIYDIDGIVKLCREKQVDAVMACYIDPCQRPYQQICDQLGLPCYGTKEQFFTFTDKHAFKNFLRENNVSTIPEYSYKEVKEGNIEYPLYVKPVDNRGSRGQTICFDEKMFDIAIQEAEALSSDGSVVIEKYMGGKQELQVTYFVIDGEPHLVRMIDCFPGSLSNRLDKIHLITRSPSTYLVEYMSNCHQKVVNMLKKTGLKNGPFFMQGFYDDGEFRFFDPGLRFPGVDYEMVMKEATGCDLVKAMIQISLTGKCEGIAIPDDAVTLGGKRGTLIFPAVRAGKIANVFGEKEIAEDKRVISYQPRHFAGEEIEWNFSVYQRFNEIDILGEDSEDLINVCSMIKDRLKVIDGKGNDMLYEWPDYEKVLRY